MGEGILVYVEESEVIPNLGFYMLELISIQLCCSILAGWVFRSTETTAVYQLLIMEAFQDTLMKLTGILNDQSEKWFKKVGGEILISPPYLLSMQTYKYPVSI